MGTPLSQESRGDGGYVWKVEGPRERKGSEEKKHRGRGFSPWGIPGTPCLVPLRNHVVNHLETHVDVLMEKEGPQENKGCPGLAHESSHHPSPQLVPAHPTSSPAPVAAASPSPGHVTWTTTVGTALMSQLHAVREMVAGQVAQGA